LVAENLSRNQSERRGIARDDKNNYFIHRPILQLNTFVFEIHAYGIALALRVGAFERHGYGSHGLRRRAATQFKLNGTAASLREHRVELFPRLRDLGFL